MDTITINVNKAELEQVLNAYSVIQDWLRKLIPIDELYTEEFLKGMEESIAELKEHSHKEVKSFADFTD